MKDKPLDHYVVFRENAYGPGRTRFAMCYNAALGSTFAEIFQIKNPKVDIPARLQEWSDKNLGWGTDELMMTEVVKTWGQKTKRLSFGIDFPGDRRLDRLNWDFDLSRLATSDYVDAHMHRPYQDHKDSIDKLLNELNQLP